MGCSFGGEISDGRCRAGEDEGALEVRHESLGYVRTHWRCRWTKLRRSSPIYQAAHSFPGDPGRRGRGRGRSAYYRLSR